MFFCFSKPIIECGETFHSEHLKFSHMENWQNYKTTSYKRQTIQVMFKLSARLWAGMWQIFKYFKQSLSEISSNISLICSQIFHKCVSYTTPKRTKINKTLKTLLWKSPYAPWYFDQLHHELVSLSQNRKISTERHQQFDLCIDTSVSKQG